MTPPAASGGQVEPKPEPEAQPGSQSDLFARKAPKTKWVTFSDGKRYEVAAVKPGQMAWVNERCIVRKPDPDDASKEIVEWDGKKYAFYLVTIAVRDKGKPMFPGTLEDPSRWVLGAEQFIHSEIDNEDWNLLAEAVLEISGLNKKAKVAVGKGSGGTTTTG